MENYMEELFQTFQEESTEVFEELDKNLLELEKSPDDGDTINVLFRLVHTLKGSANMMGLEGTGKLAHALEDLFDLIRSGKMECEGDLVNLFFDAADCLKLSVNSELTGSPLPQEYDLLINSLKNEAACVKDQSHSDVGNADENRKKVVQKISSFLEAGKILYELNIHFDDLCPMKSPGAFLAVQEIERKGEVIDISPDPDSTQIEDADAFKVILSCDEADIDAIRENAMVPGIVDEISINRIVNVDSMQVQNGETPKEAKNKPKVVQETETLRVEWKNLTDLMDMVEELFVGRAKLNMTIGDLGRSNNDSESYRELSSLYRGIDKLISRIQEKVTDIRCIPIEVELSRFNRVIRDLSVKHNKNVSLSLECGETEIDRGFWEDLQGVMVEILGLLIEDTIESTQVRGAMGKDLKSNILIRSFYAGADVVIDILCDGKPVEESKIAGEFDNINLNLGKIRGRFQVISGKDSENFCRIRVPINSTTIRALLVEAGHEMFAVNLSAIKEIVRFTNADIKTIRGKRVLSHKGSVIPIHSLSEISKKYAVDNENHDSSVGLVIRDGEKTAIIEVKQIIHEDEIILKKLKETALNSKFIQGVTVLGNGRVIIILNHQAFL